MTKHPTLTTKDVLFHVGRLMVGRRKPSDAALIHNWNIGHINLEEVDLPGVKIKIMGSQVVNLGQLTLEFSNGQKFRITCQPLQPAPTSGGN